MRFNSRQNVLLGLVAPALVQAGPTIRARADPSGNPMRAMAVKNAFKTSWQAYYDNAFPHDTLHPISNTVEDDRNGWGVTAIDSLSTAIIMNDQDAVDAILKFAPTIDFTTTKKSNESISVFESNIRYLGGMLSAYDLLNGPRKDLVKDSKQVDALLDQAKSLADSLSIAFGTKSGVPEGDIVLNPEPARIETGGNGIAGVGTLILEWTRLSDLSGDDKYYKLAKKAEDYLIHPTGVPEAWPGLIGTGVSTETGEFTDNRGGWGGGTDSFYEYLIKMYLYDPERFSEYKDRWVLAVDSSIEHLASHPSTNEDLVFFSDFDGPKAVPSSGHLNSFVGGNLILGGILLKKQNYIDLGLQLAESHYHTYKATATGIGPEGFSWVDSKNPTTSPPAGQEDFYKEAGFWITSADYILRPETMESLYYAYRVTGDTKWQDMAWEGFNQIDKHCRAGSGYSGIQDVNQEDGGGLDDFQQSFWTAEALKYMYLIFDDDAAYHVQADKPNEFVYNTEAHPVKVLA